MSCLNLTYQGPAQRLQLNMSIVALQITTITIVIYFNLKLQYISVATTMLSYKRPPAYVDTENLFSQLQDDMLITLITSTL